VVSIPQWRISRKVSLYKKDSNWVEFNSFENDDNNKDNFGATFDLNNDFIITGAPE